jgi:hypothetical protein
MSFTIYPKEGEPFCLEFAKFEFDGTNFAFYGSRTSGARPSEHAFMSVAHVAAIVSSRIVSGRYGDERRYRVYLKGRPQTIEVVAHEFDLTGEAVIFYWLSVGSNNLEREVVGNFYLAKSEVLAIFPVDGLGY